jgi:hypothetical protein
MRQIQIRRRPVRSGSRRTTRTVELDLRTPSGRRLPF